MFAQCQHGFIATTCGQCRGRAVDMGDEPMETTMVDMSRILEAAEERIERTGMREARRAKRLIESGRY